MLAHLAGNHPQQVQGIGIVGVYLQDLPVDRLRLLQVARLMVAHCNGQSFGDGCHDNRPRQKGHIAWLP